MRVDTNLLRQKTYMMINLMKKFTIINPKLYYMFTLKQQFSDFVVVDS